jgi:hypothetical protein
VNLFRLTREEPGPQPLRSLTLDDLWSEAESLGNVRVYPKGCGWDGADRRKGYEVTITGRRRSAVIKVEREHTSLHCALADAIQEARENGLGEPS